jgi:hypothetical protein
MIAEFNSGAGAVCFTLSLEAENKKPASRERRGARLEIIRKRPVCPRFFCGEGKVYYGGGEAGLEGERRNDFVVDR